MFTQKIRRAALAGTAAVASTLLVAGPAAANVVYVVSGNDLGVAAVNGSDTVTFTCGSGQTRVNGIAQLPCADLEHLQISADGDDVLDLGALDSATFPHLATPEVDTANGGKTDVVNGSQIGDVVHADAADTVLGNGGDDQLLNAGEAGGGDGDDFIADPMYAVKAGSGDDTIVDPAWGPVNGEAGDDLLTLHWEPLDQDTDYSVTLDSNGYLVTGGGQADVHLTAVGIERYDVTLGPANQRFDWHTYGGAMTIRAGGGDDVVIAGAGRDTVWAGEGNDSIDVRDGRADTVDCGPGTDSVTADATDSLVGCEHVTRTPPQTGAVVGPTKVRHGHRATYRFSADIPGAAYRCRIDHKAFRACPSTFVLRTRKLSIGRHRLQVVAVVNGVGDPTPAVKRIRIVR